MIVGDQWRSYIRSAYEVMLYLQKLKTANVMVMALSYVNVGSVGLRQWLSAAAVRWCRGLEPEVAALIASAVAAPAAAGNSGIVKTGARTRVFRAATQRAICARSPRRIISHARAHRWQFRISKSPRDCSERCSVALPAVVFTSFSTSDYVSLVARMEAMTSPRIPSSVYNVDSSTDEVVLCLFYVYYSSMHFLCCCGSFAGGFPLRHLCWSVDRRPR